MQNMNVTKKDFARRLRGARILLNFACEVILLALGYGGTYLLEQPLTSRAWMVSALQKIIHHEDSILASCDQCQYGLRDAQGGIMKKSTGWITSSKEIAGQLMVNINILQYLGSVEEKVEHNKHKDTRIC